MKDLLDKAHTNHRRMSLTLPCPQKWQGERWETSFCHPEVASVWVEELCFHLDKPFVELLYYKASRIGFDRRKWQVPASSNLSINNPQRVAGKYHWWTIPLSRWPKDLHISLLGLTPKKGKWLLIVGLSSPKNESVNSGINQEVASLVYAASVDHLAGLVDKGSFL